MADEKPDKPTFPDIKPESSKQPEAKKQGKLESILMGGVAGAATELLFPGANLLGRAVHTAVYGLTAPLFKKLWHRDTPLNELYKTAGYDMLGFLGGNHLAYAAQPGGFDVSLHGGYQYTNNGF